MIRKLTFPMFAPLPNRFFGPPGPPEGGDPAPPAGGTPPAEGGDADIMSFAPPDADAVSKALQQGGDPMAPPAGGDPKPPVPPTPKPADPKPPTGEPPAAQLRAELEKTKTELTALKKQYEAGDPRIVEAQNAVKAKESELAEARKTQADLEQRLLISNPAVTQKLRDMDAAFDKDMNRFYSRVPELNQGSVNQLVLEYQKLPFGKPEYKDARAEFEKKVNAALGAEEGHEHRKLETALGMIERTYDFVNERNATEKEVTTNARKLATDAEKGQYKTQRERVQGLLKAAAEIPEGMETTDPWHPKVALKKFTDILGDKAGDLTKGVPEFVEMVMAGIAPRTDEDYSGMTAAQVTESRQTERARFEKARDHAVDVMFNGLKALRLFPSLVKEIQRQSEELEKRRNGAPPDPLNPGGGGGGGAGTESDLKDFAVPDLANVNF